jgi:hypothetical protein
VPKGIYVRTSEMMTGKHENHSYHRRGKRHTPEAIAKMRKAHKGQVAWNKGLTKQTDERVRRFSESEDRIKKMANTKKGKKPYEMTDGIREKISKSLTGQHPSIETRAKLSLAQKGERGSNWQGGKSFEDYGADWTQTLRRCIRERDHYTCRLCDIQQTDIAFPIHHIDYDKKNNDPLNLLTLCIPCHTKTNFNRDSWKNKLKEVF